MPTTQELYESLGMAERNRLKVLRAEKILEKKANLPSPLNPTCAEHGHYPLAHTISSTASGKTMGKCCRCGNAFLLSPHR